MPPKIDEDACTGCGTCIENCPAECLEIKDEKAKLVNVDDCVECGACEENCAAEAIKLE